MDSEEGEPPPEPDRGQPRVVRLPRFVVDEEVGLGTFVSRAAQTFGIGPCGGCHSRAQRLNAWVTFSPRR